MNKESGSNLDSDVIVPEKSIRQALVFLILFSLGNAVKSVAFNDLHFTPQDCIGASITVSILMYMELYKNEDVYERFLTFGHRSKSVTIFLVTMGLTLSIFVSMLILCSPIISQVISQIKSGSGNLLETLLVILYTLAITLIYSFAYLCVAFGLFLITIPILRIISIHVFDGPVSGTKYSTKMKEGTEEKTDKSK